MLPNISVNTSASTSPASFRSFRGGHHVAGAALAPADGLRGLAWLRRQPSGRPQLGVWRLLGRLRMRLAPALWQGRVLESGKRALQVRNLGLHLEDLIDVVGQVVIHPRMELFAWDSV